MNHRQKHLSAGLIALAAILTAAPMAAWAATAPSLGLASNFTILSAAPNAGGAVSCTDGNITGDVGSSGPASSVVQVSCPISGAIIAPVSAQVLADFNTAYSQVANITSCTTISGDLAGQTLTPGVYCVAGASTTTSGTLTLSGSGSATNAWTFIIGVRNTDGTLATGALTGTGLNVVMADGSAVPCDGVNWYVAEAATMTDSNFVGTVLAGAGITFTRGTFNGDALATAAVTVTGTTVTGCTASGAKGHHYGERKEKCNQGVGNGPEGCDPGHSDKNPWSSNDENGGTPGDPGRKGGNK